MQRDLILHDPQRARNILVVGAVIHFFACGSLYGRRGFPEVDPLWLAMIWLWVPGLFISAISEKWSRKRLYHLLAYALATGFTVSWATVEIVPSRKGAIEALFGLILYGPMMMVAVGIVEGISRMVLAAFRKFPTHPYCEVCGYWLRGLTKPRCPECGTEFSSEQLDSSYCPSPTPTTRRWTTLLFIVVLALTLAFPFGYRVYSFRSLAQRGAERAEQEWKAGSATWYITTDEIKAMTPDQQATFYDNIFHHQSAAGLRVEEMWPDWEHQAWQSAYRAVIERKLREAGRVPFTLPIAATAATTQATASSPAE